MSVVLTRRGRGAGVLGGQGEVELALGLGLEVERLIGLGIFLPALRRSEHEREGQRADRPVVLIEGILDVIEKHLQVLRGPLLNGGLGVDII